MLLKATGLLTIASALLLASCSDGSSDYDGRKDTVLTLATPSVNAVAYPGVNLVSWDSVPNNDGYEIQRFENGKFIDSFKSGNTYFQDTDIQNNVQYTYKVMARGNISTRSVVTSDSKQGSASVTGILPPASTSALNLAAYEDGYDGKKAKELSKAEVAEKGLKETAVVYNDQGAIRVTFNAKSYLKYGVVASSRNNYEVTQLASVTANESTVVNNSVLPVAKTVTTAGTYKVYVKAVAMNSHFPTPDFVEVGEVTYDALNGAVTNASAAYIDAGKTVRVKFTPAKENGVKTETADYKVYRNSFDTDLVEVTALVKALSEDTFFVDDVIADNSIDYTYTIVYTDGTKFGTTAPTATVGAYSFGQTADVKVEGTTYTLDADKLKNDIKWTVTLANVDQKFEAYVLTIKKGDRLDTFVPVAKDFTEKLEGWKVEDDTTATKYYNYSANVPVGKTYLCVKVSEEGKESIYKISDAVDVSDSTVSAPTLTVSKYDDDRDLTVAGTAKNKLDDLIITVSDSIEVASDSVANYDYVLYRTSSTVKKDTTAGADGKYSITFTANIADWVKVADVEMKSNGSYNASATTVEYVGSVTSEKDMANGTYAYKVVKTNKANKVSATVISYVNVKEVPTISYTPSITASWVSSGVEKSDVKIAWEKNVQDLTQIMGTGTVLSGKVIGYKDEETDESITYVLYRATLTKDQTEVVYTAVVDEQNRLVTPGAVENKVEGETYRDNSGAAELITPTPKYVNSITYTFTDKNVSTNASYSYIVVASKTGAENVTSNFTSVTGAN